VSLWADVFHWPGYRFWLYLGFWEGAVWKHMIDFFFLVKISNQYLKQDAFTCIYIIFIKLVYL